MKGTTIPWKDMTHDERLDLVFDVTKVSRNGGDLDRLVLVVDKLSEQGYQWAYGNTKALDDTIVYDFMFVRFKDTVVERVGSATAPELWEALAIAVLRLYKYKVRQ